MFRMLLGVIVINLAMWVLSVVFLTTFRSIKKLLAIMEREKKEEEKDGE